MKSTLDELKNSLPEIDMETQAATKGGNMTFVGGMDGQGFDDNGGYIHISTSTRVLQVWEGNYSWDIHLENEIQQVTTWTYWDGAEIVSDDVEIVDDHHYGINFGSGDEAYILQNYNMPWYMIPDPNQQGYDPNSIYGYFDDLNLVEDPYAYGPDGYNAFGFDANGYDRTGMDERGFNSAGFNQFTGSLYDGSGYDKNGYDMNGFNADGLTADGQEYNCAGFNVNGVNQAGFNQSGINVYTGSYLDPSGYDVNGRDVDGFDRSGRDDEGYDRNGLDNEGFDRDGRDIEGFDREGRDIEGYDRDGRDADGFDRDGRDSEGYDREGRDSEGFDRDGVDEFGLTREDYANNPSGDSEGMTANEDGTYTDDHIRYKRSPDDNNSYYGTEAGEISGDPQVKTDKYGHKQYSYDNGVTWQNWPDYVKPKPFIISSDCVDNTNMVSYDNGKTFIQMQVVQNDDGTESRVRMYSTDGGLTFSNIPPADFNINNIDPVTRALGTAGVFVKDATAEKNIYEFSAIPLDSGDPSDCSHFISYLIKSAGYPDPNYGDYQDPSHDNRVSGVYNIEQNLASHSVAAADVQVGDLVTFRTTGTDSKGNPNYPYHIAMITNIARDENGDITTIYYVQASGHSYPNYDSFNVSAGGPSTITQVNGYYRWK